MTDKQFIALMSITMRLEGPDLWDDLEEEHSLLLELLDSEAVKRSYIDWIDAWHQMPLLEQFRESAADKGAG